MLKSNWIPGHEFCGVVAAVGKDVTAVFEETEQLIREGIAFHIEGLRADGEPIPEPTTRVIAIGISA